MDCKTARLLLDFHRPRAGELPPEEAGELERHLAGCADCDAAGRTGRRLDDHLGAAIRAVPLPDGLRDRLLGRLHEERTGRLHRRLAWAGRGLAVAAALLLATLLWLHFRTPAPQPLDLSHLIKPEGEISRLNSPESVADWFKERHQIAMVPPEFNYNFLVDCGVADVQGKQVPRLVFYRDPGPNEDVTRATVFIFTSDQFDLDALAARHGMPVDDFSKPPQVWRSRAEPSNTTYLILYYGDLNKVMSEVPGA